MRSDPSTTQVLQDFALAMGEADNALVRTASAEQVQRDFAQAVATGLSRRPRQLECRFLYDARGSALFEEICAQPEYYQTRTEAAILGEHAGEITRCTGSATIVELGSGSSVKTDLLLSAYGGLPDPVTYVPIDVSFAALEEAIGRLDRKRPNVRVVGVNATYEGAFPLLARTSPSLLVFLGSTIGNFTPDEERLFWRDLSTHLSSGDFVLLGVDLVKAPAVLEAAYNDAAGITAAFTCNLFARMNREIDAELDLETIHHEARWNAAAEQIEIYARFHRAQTLRVAPLDRTFHLEANERVLVEISRKFRVDRLRSRVTDFGFVLRRAFTDERGWFGLLLLERWERS